MLAVLASRELMAWREKGQDIVNGGAGEGRVLKI